MKRLIKNEVYWVGITDWELRKFHGDEYSTDRGSSYNSYLIRDEKTALVDTVWVPFGEKFVDNLAAEIDLKKIDYVIANHAEVDHSGALPELMRRIPDVPIYCTSNGARCLSGHYHQDWNYHTVRTGDHLNLGSRELVFIEAPMLHWPDSMFSYLTEDNILFSNDAFGQHYATEFLFNDKVDQCELFAEALKYYANILTPFNRLVRKKIEEFLSLELPLDLICPSHGVIWRDNPGQIVEKYLEWSNEYCENQITIIYDTMWNGTKCIAENIAEGLTSAAPAVAVKLYNSAKTDKNDIVAEVFKSKAVVVGSPTINKGILTSIAGLMEEMRGLGFRGKKAAMFGCYGWSGEATKRIGELLDRSGFTVVDEGFKAQWTPTDQAKDDAADYGRNLIAQFDI